MTGRVCPVHGEYSETGVCRWCEPALPSVDVGTQTNPAPLVGYWPIRRITRKEAIEMFGDESPADELARINADVVGEPLGASALRDAADLAFIEQTMMLDRDACALCRRQPCVCVSWESLLREAVNGPVSRQAVDAAQEHRLATEHAALRWERVARRWNWKHREPRWINEEWRAYVWRCWLEQMALRREGNLIAAGIPKEWP